jgi:hypothetical protein
VLLRVEKTDGPPTAGVHAPTSALVCFKSGEEIVVSSADVHRPVAAAEDVDKRHRDDDAISRGGEKPFDA